MKGYPDAGQNPVGVVRDTDDHMVELAKSNVARRAQAGGWSRAEIIDVLEQRSPS